MLTTGRLDDDDAMLQLYGGERKVRDIIKLIPYFFQYIPSNYYYHFFASTLMMPPSDHEFIKGNVSANPEIAIGPTPRPMYIRSMIL